ADHLFDAALKFARQGAGLSHPEPGNFKSLWQVLRPDDDERDNADQHQLRHAEVKQHRVGASGRTGPIARTFASEAMMSDGAYVGNAQTPRKCVQGGPPLGTLKRELAHSLRSSVCGVFTVSMRVAGAGSRSPAACSSAMPGSSFRLS